MIKEEKIASTPTRRLGHVILIKSEKNQHFQAWGVGRGS